jgi:diguanylate cyclase (GGDEF)-like protein
MGMFARSVRRVARALFDDGRLSVDEVTGLADRRRLATDLPDALSRSSIAHRVTGLVRIEVDGFEDFEATNGRESSETALRDVADLLRANVRDGDVLYRYEGAAFCVLLDATTDEEARAVAERLRASVEEAGTLTISVGLALAGGGDPGAVLGNAEDALDRAKQDGHNRVVVILGPDGPGLLLS